MAKQTDVRPKITLACVECKERNYITEEPPQRPRPARAEEVLPAGPQAHRAPRDPLTPVAWPARPLVRRPDLPAHRALRGRREKIREFADAIGDANPAYRDRASGRGAGAPGRDRAADVPVRAHLPGVRAG